MRRETRLIILVYIAAMLAFLNIRGLGLAGSTKHTPSTQLPTSDQPAVAVPNVKTPFDFIGQIEEISGNLWKVSGKVITVSPRVTGPLLFSVGQTVHITGTIAQSGLVKVVHVEPPSMFSALTVSPSRTLKGFILSPSSASPSMSNGSYEDELYGTVEAINGNLVTIDGVTYSLPYDFNFEYLAVGDMVEFEFNTNPDGTRVITDIEYSSSMGEDGSGSSYKKSDDDDEDDNYNGGNSYDDDDDEDDDEGGGDD
jgi:hypothetical protein